MAHLVVPQGKSADVLVGLPEALPDEALGTTLTRLFTVAPPLPEVAE
jgi:hypothetical protein